MQKTEPQDQADILAAVRDAERDMREQLIEKAATIGLTPDEARSAARLERNWRLDLEAWVKDQEARA